MDGLRRRWSDRRLALCHHAEHQVSTHTHRQAMNRAIPSLDTPPTAQPADRVVIDGLGDELLTVNDAARFLRFGRMKMTSITGATINAYRAQRTAKLATINREIAWLKQMFTLAIGAGKLMTKPTIKLLEEHNARQGFFEREQYQDVLKHLPEALRPVVMFAYITGWRVKSEILKLEWRQVDFKAGEVRLKAGTTKNKEGRTFPFTRDLRTLLEAQHAELKRLKKKGHVVPWVFFRMVAKGRGREKAPKRIVSFLKAFKTACRNAGCPGRIPHDLRRSAVRNLVRAGVPQTVAMNLTGHKTDSVFRRYDIVSPDDLRVAVERLDAATG